MWTLLFHGGWYIRILQLGCNGTYRLFFEHRRNDLFVILIFQVDIYENYYDRLNDEWSHSKFSNYLINKNFVRLSR